MYWESKRSVSATCSGCPNHSSSLTCQDAIFKSIICWFIHPFFSITGFVYVSCLPASSPVHKFPRIRGVCSTRKLRLPSVFSPDEFRSFYLLRFYSLSDSFFKFLHISDCFVLAAFGFGSFSAHGSCFSKDLETYISYRFLGWTCSAHSSPTHFPVCRCPFFFSSPNRS